MNFSNKTLIKINIILFIFMILAYLLSFKKSLSIDLETAMVFLLLLILVNIGKYLLNILEVANQSNYYTSKWWIFSDIILGFFSLYLMTLLAIGVENLVRSAFYYLSLQYNSAIYLIVMLLTFIILLPTYIYFTYRFERKYLTFGILLLISLIIIWLILLLMLFSSAF